MCRCSSESYDEGNNDQADKTDDFERRCDNFCLSIATFTFSDVPTESPQGNVDLQSDVHDVDEEDQEESNGNHNSGCDVCPVRLVGMSIQLLYKGDEGDLPQRRLLLRLRKRWRWCSSIHTK